MPLHPRLLEIVRCPACRSTLRLVEDEAALECTGCGLVYAVVDGIPNMLVEQARRPGA